MICLAPKKRGIFQQVKFPMQDAGKLTSIAFPLHVWGGVFFHIQCRKVLTYDDLTVYSKPIAFIFIWMNDNKGNHLRSERCVLLSLSFRFFLVSMFVCIFVCFFGFFLLVYLIVTLICLVSWLFVFFVFVCLFFCFIRLPMFFVCLFFFLVFNVFLCLRPCECIFFLWPILS